MRISDWSSDVCSSDLLPGIGVLRLVDQYMVGALVELEPHPLAEIAHGEQMAGNADQIVEIGIALLALGERIGRSEEHTSELQSLMRISYAVFCLQKKKRNTTTQYVNIDIKNSKQTTIH